MGQWWVDELAPNLNLNLNLNFNLNLTKNNAAGERKGEKIQSEITTGSEEDQQKPSIMHEPGLRTPGGQVGDSSVLELSGLDFLYSNKLVPGLMPQQQLVLASDKSQTKFRCVCVCV